MLKVPATRCCNFSLELSKSTKRRDHIHVTYFPMKHLSTALERTRIVSAALGRFLVISVSSFGLATATNWQNHQGYWHGTIVRVQTTDFNLLAHMLPTKLSYALLRDDITELQNTLDSNYGLFGLVVTDCTNETRECRDQRILHATTSKLSWRENLQVNHLPNYPFDYLRNPPPLVTEGKFDTTRALSRDSTGRTNSGQIIGRVYYVRGIPPLFQPAYLSWLKKLPGGLLSDRGAERYYSLTLALFGLSGLATWGFTEWVLQRKRLQKRLALQEQTQLLREKQRLRQQIQRQSQREKALLKKQRSNTEVLDNLQLRLQEVQQQHVQGQEQLEQRDREISLLEHQIVQQQIENDQTDKSLKRVQDNLHLTSQQAQDEAARSQDLEQAIASLTEEHDLAFQEVQHLEQQLKTAQIQIQSLAHSNKQIVRERDNLKSELLDFNKRLITVDLSQQSLAIVGGDPHNRQGVFEELSKYYGLAKRQYVEIPSLKEKSINKNTLRKRIDDCDLVAVITGYVGHDLTDMVSDLNDRRALSGKVAWVEKGKGKTGIVQSILEEFRQLNRNG